MLYQHPFSVIGFHSCDKEVGLKVVNGNDELIASNNSWDWLANGIYFWEQNPLRALEYAEESKKQIQFNKIPITTPFVMGALIELGKCLNLVEAQSLQLLKKAFDGLYKIKEIAKAEMPTNRGNNRALDCEVIKYIHRSNEKNESKPFDTIRCAFPEGEEVYPGSKISSRLHIQVCVINPECIKGYFLPRPLDDFNPYLKDQIA